MNFILDYNSLNIMYSITADMQRVVSKIQEKKLEDLSNHIEDGYYNSVWYSVAWFDAYRDVINILNSMSADFVSQIKRLQYSDIKPVYNDKNYYFNCYMMFHFSKASKEEVEKTNNQRVINDRNTFINKDVIREFARALSTEEMTGKYGKKNLDLFFQMFFERW